MALNDPTKWEYFERMNVVEFLEMVMYYHDKQEDLREKMEQQKMEMEMRNGVHR